MSEQGKIALVTDASRGPGFEATQIKTHYHQHIDWRKPGYCSLPACSLGRKRIEKRLCKCPRLHAGSEQYPGVS